MRAQTSRLIEKSFLWFGRCVDAASRRHLLAIDRPIVEEKWQAFKRRCGLLRKLDNILLKNCYQYENKLLIKYLLPNSIYKPKIQEKFYILPNMKYVIHSCPFNASNKDSGNVHFIPFT